MKAFAVGFTPHARTLIRRLPPSAKAPIHALIDKLPAEPSLGKPLRNELEGFYSIRHNRYRVIYEIDGDARLIIIHYVGLRQSVYDLFERFIQTGRR